MKKNHIFLLKSWIKNPSVKSQPKISWITFKISTLYYKQIGRRVIDISGSLIWLKTRMKLIFNLCGVFWWSAEDPVSLIHSPHLHVGAPAIFLDLLRSVQMLKRNWGAESYRTYSIPGKTAALVPEFAVEDLPSAELQPRFLCLQWSPAFAQNTLMVMTMIVTLNSS